MVNLEKKSLTLTHKKSLLQSKLPQVSSYSQIQRGQVLEGYITSIKDFGVHVRFYGDVQVKLNPFFIGIVCLLTNYRFHYYSPNIDSIYYLLKHKISGLIVMWPL